MQLDLPTSAHITIAARTDQPLNQPGARWVLLPEQDFDHYLALLLLDNADQQATPLAG